jgi:hypothetical protein
LGPLQPGNWHVKFKVVCSRCTGRGVVVRIILLLPAAAWRVSNQSKEEPLVDCSKIVEVSILILLFSMTHALRSSSERLYDVMHWKKDQDRYLGMNSDRSKIHVSDTPDGYDEAVMWLV